MKELLAFGKKEWMEQLRSGRLFLLLLLFFLFGVMSPAIAKLTPWLLELMEDSLKESGMTLTAVTVDAMTSWTQFFKNAPIALIAFVLLESSIFTKEYQTGTILLALTKGLKRYQVVLAKTLVLVLLWTVGYALCFAVTYGYTAWFWDNSVVHQLLPAAGCWWLLGLFAVLVMVLSSVLCGENAGVLAGTGGTFLLAYLLELLPKSGKYSPAKLMAAAELLTGTAEADTYRPAVAVTLFLGVLCLCAGIVIHNKKQL